MSIEDESRKWLELGNDQFNKGNFREAIDSFDKALQIKPDDHEAWYGRGNALVNLGRYEEAIDSYDKALQIKPDYHEAWCNRGNALDDLGRYEEAIDSCDKAVQIKPDFHQAWFNRGNALVNLGRYEEAIDSYDKAVQIKPDYHEAWYNRGIALGNLGRYEESIDSYDKAIQIKPDKHEAWYGRGSALRKLGRYEDAIDSYDKALQIKPDYHEAWNNRGFALDDLGRYEEAIDSYDKALQIKPDYHEAWNNRGVALYTLGRYEEAIDSYDKAIQIKPDYHEAWYNRGFALGNLGRYEESIDSYDKALQIKPDYHDAWYNRGVALFNLGRYEESIDSYDKAIQIKPDDHDAWNNRGSTLDDLGRYEEAIDSYDKALDIKPDKHEAWFNRGNIAFRLKSTENNFALFRGSGLEEFAKMKPSGYGRAILSYDAGIRYSTPKGNQPDTAYYQEGRGKLHRAKGDARIRKGIGTQDFQKLYEDAIQNYETALDEFNKIKAELPEEFLETILRLMSTHLKLGNIQLAELWEERGTTFFEAILAEPERKAKSKQELTRRFASQFKDIKVLRFVQQKKYRDALNLAELDKNTCLSWILDRDPEALIDRTVNDLLNTQTAIVYWHLSDYALTTFLLLPNGETHTLHAFIAKPKNGQLPFLGLAKDWENDYKNDDDKEAWRQELQVRLAQLRQILQIDTIEAKLAEHSLDLQRLLLIPHRRLHLFPIHALFSDRFTVSYLPSLQYGHSLLTKAIPVTSTHLLTIENAIKDVASRVTSEEGNKKLDDVLFAYLEAEAVGQMYSAKTSISRQDATLKNITESIDNIRPTILLFTGHGKHDFDKPERSVLYLYQDETLNLTEISHLSLISCQLACLSACETSIASDKTITSEYVGLSSAFLYAGASSVIGSLWSVTDISSAFLMAKFYELYRTNPTHTAQCLRASQHWMRDEATAAKLLNILTNWMANIPLKALEKIELRAQVERLQKLDPDAKPYANPYYWAAFCAISL